MLGGDGSVGEGVEGWSGEEVVEVGHGDSLFHCICSECLSLETVLTGLVAMEI